MKIVFAGTPEISAICLKALLDAGLPVTAVLTQPDRPKGRSRQNMPSPVKAYAQAQDIPVHTPERFDSDAVSWLEQKAPTLLVVVAYGLILPQRALDIPEWGAWNVHVSLLPRWRGAAPIQRAIEAGDQETGITLMQMDAGLDTGPILAQTSYTIEPKDTSESVHNALAVSGASLLVDTIRRYQHAPIPPIPQLSEGVTYAKKLSKAEGELDWNESAALLERRVRAFYPWPGTFCSCNGERLKILDVEVIERTHADVEPGVVLQIDDEGLQVATSDGVLCIKEIQWPGKRRMKFSEARTYWPLWQVGSIWKKTTV